MTAAAFAHAVQQEAAQWAFIQWVVIIDSTDYAVKLRLHVDAECFVRQGRGRPRHPVKQQRQISLPHQSVWCIISKSTANRQLLAFAKNIYFCLQAWAQREIIRPDTKPSVGLLIEIEPTTDLDYPAIVQANLAVVEVGIQFNI